MLGEGLLVDLLPMLFYWRLTIPFKFFKMGFSMGSAKELYRTLREKKKNRKKNLTGDQDLSVVNLPQVLRTQPWISQAPSPCSHPPEFSRK